MSSLSQKIRFKTPCEDKNIARFKIAFYLFNCNTSRDDIFWWSCSRFSTCVSSRTCRSLDSTSKNSLSTANSTSSSLLTLVVLLLAIRLPLLTTHAQLTDRSRLHPWIVEPQDVTWWQCVVSWYWFVFFLFIIFVCDLRRQHATDFQVETRCRHQTTKLRLPSRRERREIRKTWWNFLCLISLQRSIDHHTAPVDRVQSSFN